MTNRRANYPPHPGDQRAKRRKTKPFAIHTSPLGRERARLRLEAELRRQAVRGPELPTPPWPWSWWEALKSALRRLRAKLAARFRKRGLTVTP